MNLTSLASVFTILAFYIAWVAFYIERRTRLQQRKEEKIDILKSISQELELMNVWLGSSYDDLSYSQLQEPWHPFHMVYGLSRNDAIKNAISLKSVSLLSEKFLKTLVTLNQKLGSFEQHVNRLIQFNTSDPITVTKAFYYYDNKFSKYSIVEKWVEFEKLSRKLSTSKKLLPEEVHLIGNIKLLKDLHVQGIGSETDPKYLRYTFVVAKQQITEELEKIKQEGQFKQHPVFVFMDTVILGSFVLSLYILIQFIARGGGNVIGVNSIDAIIPLGAILLVSLILGYIKYGSLAPSREDWSWQLNFVELWNDVANFLIAGLVGYYFTLVRWPSLSKGEPLNISDFGLFIIFAMGLFGHLCVVSNNITKGIEAILKKVLEK